ncbi:MAG: dihydrofolate reductase [Thermoflexibacter sp.]|nr:dihydrofolate reductase [Thermoflexibacter sp.]
MIIAAIVAKSTNHVIGKNNQLPWRLPADLKYFKQLTLHHHLLMGRKTFESIGKPLPQRTTIVLSRNLPSITQEENLFWADTLEDGIKIAQEKQENELFIIGGAEIYRLAMPFLHRLYITEIHATVEGDAYFPLIASAEWTEISREKHKKDEKNSFDFDFVVYEKNKY